MTTDLHDLMSERAERLDPPTLDASAIMAAGDRRVRRRRWTGGAGAAVLCVAAALAAPAVLGGSGTDGLVAERPADSEDPVAWVSGSVLHTSPDGPEVELGRQPVALVQGESGFVFSDAEGDVHVVLDDRDLVLPVGRMETPDAAHFESDGDVVAWVDADEGEPSYAVMDLSEGPGVTRLPVTDGTVTPLEREHDMTAAVAAVDGYTVYLRTAGGATAWEPFSGDNALQPLAVAPGTQVVVEDVKDGVFHYQRTGGTPAAKEEAYVVGPDLTSGTELDAWDGILSPDGRYLVSETADENRVFDTTTGERQPFDLGEYAFVAGYRWLDGDTYVALGLKDLEAEQADLLSCEVATGTCRAAVTDLDLTSGDALQLPMSEAW
ncbi:hypothetical protein [Nocardioides campestrisoli]|uniref:hypothetical protein n=1 Tax=Nocardioides campestrisoli TaxID=2736757 RepID=UPI00163DB4C9|nr:hypothetical protein [Nocardioides campestrisoli]